MPAKPPLGGRGRKLRAGSPNSIGSHPCTISVAGTRLLRSAIRSNSRGHGILGPRPRRIVPRSKKLQTAAAEERRKHPGATVEVWAMDEHRIGLKPITRGVWAPIGERPIALGHHRFEWLYVTGFVEPATGQTVWNVANAVCKEMFEPQPETLDAIEAALARHGVELFANPSPGCRLVSTK